MKTLITFCTATLICFASIAQLEVKTKTTIAGKNSVLLEDTPDVNLGAFYVQFTTWVLAGDEGGNNAKGTYNSVYVTTELSNFDNAFAQEITDEAYAYYLDMWKARGLNVTCATAAELEATKTFAKKKEKLEIVNSGAYLTESKYAKTLTVLPSNTVHVKAEAFGVTAFSNGGYFLDFTKSGADASFGAVLNFVEFKTGIGSQSFIKAEPSLTITSGSGINKNAKAKYVGLGLNTTGTGSADFLETIDKGDTWKFIINREKYKSAAMELIKKTIDDQFAEYDAIIAKEKG